MRGRIRQRGLVSNGHREIDVPDARPLSDAV